MDAVIRPLRESDRTAVARLLDDTVGAGFWGFAEGAGALSFVAASGAPEEEVAGAVLACLEPSADPDARTALGGSSASAAGSGELVLHIHQLVVAQPARRAGIASRLMTRAETEARELGAGAAFAFAWLPAGRPDPDAVPFYVAAGYQARPDIPGFYAEGSVATGALCPYCGEPPCRCAARPFVKALRPG